MKAKSIVYSLLLVLFTAVMIVAFVPTSATPAHADMGPKPSVQITFINVPSDQPCYATMLSKRASTGPHHVVTPEDVEERIGSETTDPAKLAYRKAVKAFAEYEDPDGFYFLNIMSDCASGRLDCMYYPPDVFKIVVYFPDSDAFVTSGILERYAFDSYFKVDLKNGEMLVSEIPEQEIQAVKNYNYAGEILALVIRILLTIGIELFMALLFGYKQKKKIGVILLTNLITNVMLNVILYLLYMYSGLLTYILLYFVAEGVVFIVEAIVYSVTFRKDTPKSSVVKSLAYTLTANLCSFSIGLVMGIYCPTIF